MRPRNSKAEQIGKWLGRAWRKFLRQEAHATRWMIDRGTPAFFATSLLWVVKLAVLLLLVYTAFWFAVLITLVAVIAWIVARTDLADDEDKPRWRYGLMGFGLYRNGIRLDPHDPKDEY